MKKEKKQSKKFRLNLFTANENGIISGNITYVLSILCPIIIMVLLYASRSIFPFGTNCYLRSDMYHQYAPFFSELWDKIRHGESLTYSWDIGMGTNFISLIAYYLASPSNWFIVLFPQKYIIEIMNAIIILKLAASSFTFTYYISKHFNTRKITIIMFGVFYALSGYASAYSWNVMWLDCMWLLPLILLGLEKLVKENKCFLYCLSLGLCIYTNYYISIMVCISVVLYFAVLMFSYDGVRSPLIYLKKIFNFGIYSLLSGGLAACLLLPEIYTFTLSASSSVTFPKKLSAYFSIIEVLVRQLINVDVHLGLEHYPNIYAGVAVFLLIPLYIMNKKINSREKVGKCVILLIFLLSYNLNTLNFIWHGFHFPNSLPCRQAFIYIFFLLIMSYEAIHHIRYYNKRQFTTAFWIGFGLIILMEYLFKDSDMYDFTIFYISGGLILIYGFLMYLYRNRLLRNNVITFMAILIAIIECTINMDATGVNTTGRTSYMLDYDAVETVTNRIYEKDDSFYRMDKFTGARTKNDGAWHNYHSISTFSSTSSAGMSKFYKYLGLVNSTNAYSYDGSTIVTDSLFSVKYLISNQHIREDNLRTYVTGNNGEFIYQNHYTLPIGYMVPSAYSDLKLQSIYNPIEIQNLMVNTMTGVSDVFELIEEFRGYSEFSFTAPSSGHVYITMSGNTNDIASIYVNGDMLNYKNLESNPHVLDAGYVEAGECVDVFVDSPLTFNAYTLNEEKFIEAYNILNSSSYQISDWSETHFEGTVNSDDNGILMLSIPYDKGWSVYVDGKKTETFAIHNALTGVYVSAGSHTVELKYVPVNLIKGCIITLLCIIILIAVYIVKKNIRKGVINTSKLPAVVNLLISEDDIVPASLISDKTIKDSNSKPEGSANTDREDTKDILKEITDNIDSMNDFDNIEIETED